MARNSFILCIETGTDTCSVALALGGEPVALRESREGRDHAARVAVYTDELLSEAGIGGNGRRGFGYAELSAVAVSKGPGSYTGLRIGVSFAKGLCYGLGVPLISVGSLDSLCAMAITSLNGNAGFRQKCAEAIVRYERMENAGDVTAEFRSVRRPHFPKRGDTVLIPMIDARRMEVYGQVFDARGNPMTEPGAWIIDEGSLAEYRDRDVCIFGSGAEKCREALPRARHIEVEPSALGMIGLATRAFEARDFEDTAYFEPFYLKDFVITTSRRAGTSAAILTEHNKNGLSRE